MKKALLLFAVLVFPLVPCRAVGLVTSSDQPSFREMFKETEGKVIDWAIGSSAEPIYAYDFLENVSLGGGQTPIVYVTPYISADFGYISADGIKGSCMIGGSLRVNKLLEDLFTDNLSLVKGFVPNSETLWSRLFVGPFIAHNFTNAELRLGLKAGFKF